MGSKMSKVKPRKVVKQSKHVEEIRRLRRLVTYEQDRADIAYRHAQTLSDAYVQLTKDLREWLLPISAVHGAVIKLRNACEAFESKSQRDFNELYVGRADGL